MNTPLPPCLQVTELRQGAVTVSRMNADDITLRAPMIMPPAGGEPSGQLRGKPAGGDYGCHALAPNRTANGLPR